MNDQSEMRPTFHDKIIGSVVAGRYRVLELVGRGGMARVYPPKHGHRV